MSGIASFRETSLKRRKIASSSCPGAAKLRYRARKIWTNFLSFLDSGCCSRRVTSWSQLYPLSVFGRSGNVVLAVGPGGSERADTAERPDCADCPDVAVVLVFSVS